MLLRVAVAVVAVLAAALAQVDSVPAQVFLSQQAPTTPSQLAVAAPLAPLLVVLAEMAARATTPYSALLPAQAAVLEAVALMCRPIQQAAEALAVAVAVVAP